MTRSWDTSFKSTTATKTYLSCERELSRYLGRQVVNKQINTEAKYLDSIRVLCIKTSKGQGMKRAMECWFKLGDVKASARIHLNI